MRKNKLVLLTLLASLSMSSAHALSVGMGKDFTSFGPFTTEDGVSKTLSVPVFSKDQFKQIVVAAKEDASMFIATEGEVRGVALERALQTIREVFPQEQASDLELALAITGI
jgi:conserverd hypothetical protein